MKNTILLLGFFLFIACNNNQNQENKENNTSINTDVKIEKLKTTVDSLQGLWVSVDDPKSFLKIEGQIEISIYDKDTVEKSAFYVAKDKNHSTIDSTAKDGSYYILKSGNEYSIEYLSNDKLSLIYLGRGNTLNYVKVK